MMCALRRKRKGSKLSCLFTHTQTHTQTHTKTHTQHNTTQHTTHNTQHTTHNTTQHNTTRKKKKKGIKEERRRIEEELKKKRKKEQKGGKQQGQNEGLTQGSGPFRLLVSLLPHARVDVGLQKRSALLAKSVSQQTFLLFLFFVSKPAS